MTDQPEQIPADDRSLADRLHGTTVPSVPESEDETAGGPLGRVGDLLRHRPYLLVAAVAAGFLLGRLVKRAARSRG